MDGLYPRALALKRCRIRHEFSLAFARRQFPFSRPRKSESGNSANQSRPPPSKPAATVYFTISGKHGAPLTPALSDLAASIDGHPVPVTALRPANAEKLLFALIVDTSGSSYDNRVAIKDAAFKIFEGLSSGGNQGYLVLFSWEPQMSPRPLQPPQVKDALDNIHYSGGSGLYDAIAQTCTKRLSRAANPSSPRRAIFVISDGVDNLGNVRNSNYPSVTLDQAEDAALREGVSIFSLMDLSIGPSGSDKKPASCPSASAPTPAAEPSQSKNSPRA